MFAWLTQRGSMQNSLLRDEKDKNRKPSYCFRDTVWSRLVLLDLQVQQFVEFQVSQIKQRRKLATFTIFLLLATFFFSSYEGSNKSLKSGNKATTRPLWEEIGDVLDTSVPHISPPSKVDAATWPARYTIEMPESDVIALQKSHSDYVRLSSDLSLKGTYQPRTRGIVSTAGGRYLNVFLVSLRCLRRTGSTLPVELFLEVDSEYDEYFCEKLLPTLNARCRVISHSIGTKLASKLEAFQLKAFAILASSFENVLFLDADNLALSDPAAIFESTLYETMGLILWPDFLVTSESPILAEVQGEMAAKWTGPRNISLESGQIFVNKAIHERTLLLSLYYNYYGPVYYYPLFTQGGNGEGDKETFGAAAAYYRAPYHIVSEMVNGFGFFDHKDNPSMDIQHFKNIGMIQFYPDWHGPSESKQALFMHWNWPKLDAHQFLDEEHLQQHGSTNKHRIWQYAREEGDVFVPWDQSSFSTGRKSWGRDSEAIAFEQMMRVACVDLSMKPDMLEQCRRLRDHYRLVYSGTAV